MSSYDVGRVLPHDLAAECAVLGAILIRPDVLFDVREQVGPDDFYRDANKRIFRHIERLFAEKTAIDPLTLRDSLTRTSELEQVGVPYLFGLTDGVPHSTHAIHYARIVREHCRRRQIVYAAQRMMAEAYAGERGAADVLDGGQASLAAIADRHVAGGSLLDMKAVMGAAMDYLEVLAKEHRSVTGIPTGLTDLDEMTRGFQPQELIVIGARPSVGKTSLALNVAEHVVLDRAAARVCVLFSLEMGHRSLGVRALASVARINHGLLTTGYITEAAWRSVSDGMSRLSESGLYIDDSSSTNVFDVRATSRRVQNERGRLDLVVIDYLQLMRGAERAENKNLEISEISRSLKVIAKDLGVPVILLSQLSRAAEQRTNHRPQLSDLRDSGAIEQDADLVLLIHREEKYSATPENRGIAEIIIAKQRNGPTGTVRVAFREDLMRFEDLARSHDEAARLPYAEASA